jgi:hypothetical protein
MTPELQKYYENRLDMMGSQGWKDLIADVEVMLKTTDTLAGVTADTLRFRQGEISIMRWLVSLKETSELAYEELKLENT